MPLAKNGGIIEVLQAVWRLMVVVFQIMKMPGNDTSNSGLYEYEESTVMEEFNDTAENDFSEYLWMEHEEEFDKEVNKNTFTY